MSQPCAIQDCKRASRTLCQCCNQNLCRDHFNQHDDLLNSQLNPLTEQINQLSERLTTININKIKDDARDKFNQWRLNAHQIIDHFYENKCQELDRYVNESIEKQQKEINDLQTKLNKLIEKQETTKDDIDSLTPIIHNSEEKLNAIEHIHFDIDTHPLVIDDTSIQIGKPKVYDIDLLNLLSPYRTIECGTNRSTALASNHRFVLIHIDPNLCLIDENLSIIKQIEWVHALIFDICWSSVLERFIITTEKEVLSIDQTTMSSERLQQIQGESWGACECSHQSLYLSRRMWDSSILEFNLSPSIRFEKLWKTNDKQNQQQRIDAIAYTHEKLALLINDQSIKTKLLELRSTDTFFILWSFQLDVVYNTKMIRCCLHNQNEFLLADWSTSHILHITNDGKLKQTHTYNSKPLNITWFSSNTLAILTPGSINFHKL